MSDDAYLDRRSSSKDRSNVDVPSTGGVNRRSLLKAAGLGIAATAGAVAVGTTAVAQSVGEDKLLPPLVGGPQVAVPLPLQDAKVVCGTVSTTRLKGNTIEISVPAGRQVLVREIPEATIPLAEVVVNISRDIVKASHRSLLIPEIIPT